MTCCERTLARLSMVTALVHRDGDEFSSFYVVKASLREGGLCDHCVGVFKSAAVALRPGARLQEIDRKLAFLYLDTMAHAGARP